MLTLEQMKIDAHERECEKDGDDLCEFCKGTGVVAKMERVYPNEPHMADVGTAPCPVCRSRDNF